MATVQQNTEEQSTLERFAELAWLDMLISFIFRLIAKLAEPFLAFGLVASAIDYGSHGGFLAGNAHLMAIWIATQALALEGSGGSVLAMSFDADKEGDAVKAWIQRILAISLMIVGGIMFFAEMAESVPGFKVIIASGGYVYAMAALRSLVSLGYLAVCRTRAHRYSGAPAQPQITAPSLTDEVAQQVEEAADELRDDMHADFEEMRTALLGQFDELRNAVRGQLAELPSVINEAAQSMHFEVDPAQLTAQINAAVAHAVDQALHSTQPQKNTDELAQPTAQGKETVKIPAITEEPARRRVQRYIEEQRAACGRTPDSKEVAEVCGCALRTAQVYRKEVMEA